MKKILLLIILFPSMVFAQNDWVLQNPYPTNLSIVDIAILDNNTLIAVGDKGLVMKSIDNGRNWTFTKDVPLLTDNDSYNQRIRFINDNTGYLFSNLTYQGFNGKIFKTTNKGENWFTETLYSHRFSTSIRDVEFINNSTGYIVGIPNIFFKTTTGGQTWDSISIGTWYDPIIDKLDIEFFNSSTGFMISRKIINNNFSDEILKTTDGGNNWFSSGINSSNPLQEIIFINSTTGYITSLAESASQSDFYYKTTNAGLSWQYITLNGPDIESLLIKFDNHRNIYCSGYESKFLETGYKIYKSIDNGSSFMEIFNSGIGKFSIKDFHIINNTISAFGFAGKFMVSTNAGILWKQNSFIYQDFSDIIFKNKTEWFAITSSHSSKINYYTSDAGNAWKSLNSDFDFICFKNNNTCLAIKDSRYIFRSTNGGNTFDSLTNIASVSNLSMSFIQHINGSVWYAYGSHHLSVYRNPILYKTTNDGESWIILGLPDDAENGINFFNENTGYTYSERPYIHKTTNGGLNWITTNLNFGDSEYLEHTQFVSKDTGFIYFSGYSPHIYVTTNSGLNWTKKLIPNNQSHQHLKFINNLTGYFVSDGYYAHSTDYIYKTTNGGNSWFETYKSPSIAINGFAFYEDIEIGYGFNGELYRPKDQSVNVQSISEQIPEKYFLSQNYPNPFNPATNIEFQIPNSELVSLKVYDIAGKLVTTLVNENLSAGNYKVQFNGLSFSSGVYFYTLETESLIQTRKMLLIK